MHARLHNDHLALVPLHAAYEKFYIDLANHPAIRERINNSIPYMRDHFDELLKRDSPHHYVWIIEEHGTSKGAITFAPLKSHPQIFQGGYWLDPSVWGRGLASQALKLASDYLFRDGGAERIQAMVEPENVPSMRVLEKCGFRHEGLLHKYYPSKYRGLLDVHMYARTRPMD